MRIVECTEICKELNQATDKHWNECRQIAQYDNEIKNLKRLLKLAYEDITTAITEEKCLICGLDYCGNDTVCKWRYEDEVLKAIS